jgi:hypothetical protein
LLQWNTSGVPAPVHMPEVHPAQFTQVVPDTHCESAVHQQLVPDALQVPVGEVTSLQLPLEQPKVWEHIGRPGLVPTWQCIPSQFVPEPVHMVLSLQLLIVESLMHFFDARQSESCVHQQH